MNSTYDIILQLPLFQGLTLTDMNTILGTVKFTFRKFKPRETITVSGTTDRRLHFILNGDIHLKAQSETDGGRSRDGRKRKDQYEVNEYLSGPFVIEPYHLFGLDNTYRYTCTAITDVGEMSVSKSAVLNHLCKFPIFLTNLLNLLSRRAQLYGGLVWSTDYNSRNAEAGIRNFFLRHFESMNGRKEVFITIKQLSQATGYSTPTVSTALKSMADSGKLTLPSQGTIVIADAHKL